MAVLGNQSTGGLADTWKDLVAGTRYIPQESGVIVGIYSRSNKDTGIGGTAALRFAIYSDNAGAPDTIRMHSSTDVIVTTTLQWWGSTSFTEDVTNGTRITTDVPLWIMGMNDNPFTIVTYYDPGYTNQSAIVNPTISTWNWVSPITSISSYVAADLQLYIEYIPDPKPGITGLSTIQGLQTIII